MNGQTVSIQTPYGSTTYTIRRLLGSGFLGAVYEAEVSFPGGQPMSLPERIAVKAPHAQLNDDLRKRFWQEYDALERIAEAARALSLQLHVPRAWRGKLVNNGAAGGEVLCMDLVQGKELTAFFVEGRNAEGRLFYGMSEKLALEIGVQFAELIEALEWARVSTADRKVSDLYWDNASRRLTVLDWNVLGEGDAPFRTNAAIFGRLWFELLTGALPPPPDEHNRRAFDLTPAWATISLGTRAIVAKALAGASAGYAAVGELKRDLDAHRRDFDLLDTNFDQLLQRARDAVEAAQDAERRLSNLVSDLAAPGGGSAGNGRLPDLYKEYMRSFSEADRLVDLVERKAAEGVEYARHSATDLRKRLKPAVKVVDDIKKRLLTEPVDIDRDYGRALRGANLLRALFADADDVNNLLNVERWAVVAQAGQDGLSSSPRVYLSDYINDLAALLSDMDRNVWDDAQRKWTGFAGRITGMPSHVRGNLDWLGKEIELWLSLHSAAVAERDGEHGKVVAAVGEARRTADAFPENYRDALYKALDRGDWKTRVAFAKARGEHVGNKFDDLLKEIDAAVGEGRFKDAHQRLSSWHKRETDLGGVQLDKAKRRQLSDTWSLVELLIHLQEALNHSRWDVLFEPDNSLLDRAYRLNVGKAASSVCLDALGKNLAATLQPLAQQVKELMPSNSSAPSGFPQESSIQGAQSSAWGSATPWQFVATPAAADGLLAWVSPWRRWQNSLQPESDKRNWLREPFPDKILFDRFWQAGENEPQLVERRRTILNLRNRYEAASKAEPDKLRSIAEEAKAANVELVDSEDATVTRQKAEWMAFLERLRSGEIEPTAQALVDYDQRLQDILKGQKEIIENEERFDQAGRTVNDVLKEKEQLDKAAADAAQTLLQVKLICGWRLLQELDDCSIKEYAESAEGKLQRCQGILDEVEKLPPSATTASGAKSAGGDVGIDQTRGQSQITDYNVPSKDPIRSGESSFQASPTYRYEDRTDASGYRLPAEHHSYEDALKAARAQHEAWRSLDGSAQSNLIALGEPGADLTGVTQTIQSLVSRLGANAPVCVRRLIQRAETHETQRTLEDFDKKNRSWWVGWQALGQNSAVSIPAGLEKLKDEINAYREANLMVIARYGISVEDVLLAWKRRIESAKSVHDRLQTIQKRLSLNDREIRKPQDRQRYTEIVLQQLVDFPAEALWLNRSTIQQIAETDGASVPKAIQNRIDSGGRVVESRQAARPGARQGQRP